MRVFRHLMAPPISQDQFQLLCPSWSKRTESPSKRVSAAVSGEVADRFHLWRDRKLTAWLDTERRPTFREIRRLFDAVATLIASQEVGTIERNRLAAAQELEVINLLVDKGWARVASRLIDRRAELKPLHFMHKTRFATRTRPQEVDIACGLRDTYVLAMECKVTNDQTNSVKRVNDVLKKATAWKEHWGSFVKTAALLQGVIASRDVDRLLDVGVQVFWSHDLGTLGEWLDAQGESTPR